MDFSGSAAAGVTPFYTNGRGMQRFSTIAGAIVCPFPRNVHSEKSPPPLQCKTVI
jgi:hypothetical protein